MIIHTDCTLLLAPSFLWGPRSAVALGEVRGPALRPGGRSRVTRARKGSCDVSPTPRPPHPGHPAAPKHPSQPQLKSTFYFFLKKKKEKENGTNQTKPKWPRGFRAVLHAWQGQEPGLHTRPLVGGDCAGRPAEHEATGGASSLHVKCIEAASLLPRLPGKALPRAAKSTSVHCRAAEGRAVPGPCCPPARPCRVLRRSWGVVGTEARQPPLREGGRDRQED